MLLLGTPLTVTNGVSASGSFDFTGYDAILLQIGSRYPNASTRVISGISHANISSALERADGDQPSPATAPRCRAGIWTALVTGGGAATLTVNWSGTVDQGRAAVYGLTAAEVDIAALVVGDPVAAITSTNQASVSLTFPDFTDTAIGVAACATSHTNSLADLSPSTGWVEDYGNQLSNFGEFAANQGSASPPTQLTITETVAAGNIICSSFCGIRLRVPSGGAPPPPAAAGALLLVM